jgi:sporulation-control protein
MFKKMMKAFTAQGLEVDTVLELDSVHPGSEIVGAVEIVNQGNPIEIDEVKVSLVALAESENNGDQRASVEFASLVISESLHIDADQRLQLPFRLVLPWESPITSLDGRAIPGSTIKLSTQVAIARAIDKGDSDAIAVVPLRAQLIVIEALEALGFKIRHADIELGTIFGLRQQLPFFQEIEFLPAANNSKVEEIELTFVANPETVDVVLEADKRAGMYGGSHDFVGRFTFAQHNVNEQEIHDSIDHWLRTLPDRPPIHLDKRHHGGNGLGGAATGLAAGILGGMAVGEVFDEVGDFFEGE